MKQFKYLSIALIGLLSFYQTNAQAFGVDVCFNSEPNKMTIINCINVNQSCRTSNLDNKALLNCKINATADSLSGLTGTNNIIGGRSTVHSDAMYAMAQLIGFTPWQAYQILIYSEAADQGQYTPFDQSGHPILSDDEMKQCISNWHGKNFNNNCLIMPLPTNGANKFNATTGGMIIHWMARFSPSNKMPTPAPKFTKNTKYLTPENSKFELVTQNLHAWAFNYRSDACSAGITKDQSIDSSPLAPCEDSSKVLYSPQNFFSPGFSKLTIPFATELGQLIIEQNETETIYATNTSLNHYIYPQQVKYAKMGIYLHSYADRYSHHACADHSYFYKQANGNYNSVYDTVNCAQGNHFLWHAWEQGTNQSNRNLEEEHQTIRPALDMIYDELINFAQQQHILINPNLNKEVIINQLVEIIQTYNAQQRLNKMTDYMDTVGVLPLPGHGSMKDQSVEQWLCKAGAISCK